MPGLLRGAGQPPGPGTCPVRALDAAARLHSGRAARRARSLAIRALSDYPRGTEVRQFADAVRSWLPIA
jgi:hypothetical protein